MSLMKRESETMSPLGSFKHEMDRLFDEFFVRRWPSLFEPGTFAPPVEVGETPEAVFVNIQVPGLTKDSLKVRVSERALTVKGEVKEEKEDENKSYYRKEFHYGQFLRTVPLPEHVDVNKATADLDNGVLKVRIPKSEDAKSRAVEVPVH